MPKKQTGKKWIKGIVFAILAIIVIVGFIFVNFNKPKVSSDMVSVEKGSITTYYSFAGSIEAKSREMVFADQALQIESWNVKEGDVVKVDDILYTTKTKVEKKATTAGEILKIYADINQQIMPGAKILEIVDYTNYLLKIKVDEYDFAAVKAGGKASVKLNSLSKEIEGTVDEISKEGTYTSGVTFFQATITIPADEQIRVGMSAEAKVLNKEAIDVPILPIEAIMFDAANTPYVNQFKDEVVTRTDVVLGITDGVYVEIKSGLILGDKVTVKKVNTLENFRPGNNG